MMNIINLILQHMYMVIVSVTIASLIAIPIAIILYKKKRGMNTILYFISLMQSFPALGMFALLVPLIGIGMEPVIIALTLYALLPIFQSTIIALKAINPEYYDIIESLNISKKKVFWKIEYPLILPNVISGIKLATIYSISFATIGTLVGAGGLGDLIYLGLQTMNIKTTLSGIIPLLILTIVTSYAFNKIEKHFYTEDYKVLLKKK